MLRRRNAGSNTAVDHVIVVREALRQLPFHRKGNLKRPGFGRDLVYWVPGLDEWPGLSVGGLLLGGGDHADLAVEAAVVPPVEVLEERELQLLDGAPGAAPGDQFGLDLPDGGLGQGVVIRVAGGADGGDGTGRGEGVGVADGQVLAAGVGVMDQPVEPVLTAGPDRQLECLQRQLGAQVGGEGPADDPAAEHVDDQRQ